MAISVFDLFKIGIGPSSSHTVGPMRAANAFAALLAQQGLLQAHAAWSTAGDAADPALSTAGPSRIEVVLYGSLAATGIGHATDRAVILGLMGHHPETVDPAEVDGYLRALAQDGVLHLDGRHPVPFVADRDVRMVMKSLPYHPNGLTFHAYDGEQAVLSATYYSVGGGFIVTEDEASGGAVDRDRTALPYDFSTADELLALCRRNGLRISQLMMENEKAWRPEAETRAGLLKIWHAMDACVDRGLQQQGILPGGLEVKRRAFRLHTSLRATAQQNLIGSTLSAMQWVNLFALAVNEENAAGGRVVTAPTNGAAGIIPAVLRYYMRFESAARDEDVIDFLLAAAAIGILCKKNASISGAEVGCQGEVGSACAMAAAGLAEVLGGTPEQVENAAEIGLEHNLGLTCDPVGGLVQVPCIERNAIASIKAINAAQLALAGDGTHFISLDQVIRTMRDTGADMMDKYKETSLGGLAVARIAC
jgi:L-serine dehydratase